MARSPHICELPESSALFLVQRRNICIHNFRSRKVVDTGHQIENTKEFTGTLILNRHKRSYTSIEISIHLCHRFLRKTVVAFLKFCLKSEVYSTRKNKEIY